MKSQLRLWWPEQNRQFKLSSGYILFGWFISSSPASLDVVVALAIEQASLSQFAPCLEEILGNANRDLPAALQEKSMVSILGQCADDISKDSSKVRRGVKCSSSTCVPDGADLSSSPESQKKWKCGCSSMMETCGVVTGSNTWIKLVHESCGEFAAEKLLVPKVDHVHWDGQVVFPGDVHVIFYEAPAYGSHHFSLSYSDVSHQARTPLKKPNWVNELHLSRPVIDLDRVILAINSSAALARFYLNTESAAKKSLLQFSLIWMLCAFLSHALAIVVATLSTLFYFILRCLHGCLNLRVLSWMWITCRKAFNTTWANVEIRSCQILYWPIFLQWGGPRSYSCVEYEEKAALRRHSMWSNLVVDILLGNLIGLALLYNAESACSWVMDFGSDVSNLLRTGCVWLMGVPAGFKLNTEVAAVLGMISLNVIQIWSTLCIFAGIFLSYIIRGLALLGMFFGATVLAALIRDMITITSLHVSTLHWLISLVYSLQTKALAALWRLFRGQKWNPLRLRFDSYDYTVEQHIVGSLLFTPLLLLLPTTSVLYIFFTIMSSSLSILCILTEVIISLIHATPYVKIFLWLLSPRRFPAGIWLQIASCKPSRIKNAERNSLPKDGYSHSKNVLGKAKAEKSGDGKNTLVSFLHSTFPSIGQIISPDYKKVFTGGFKPLVLASAQGILTGNRVPRTLEARLPSTMPWMAIPIRDYWRLCRNSVLSCMESRDGLPPTRFGNP